MRRMLNTKMHTHPNGINQALDFQSPIVTNMIHSQINACLSGVQDHTIRVPLPDVNRKVVASVWYIVSRNNDTILYTHSVVTSASHANGAVISSPNHVTATSASSPVTVYFHSALLTNSATTKIITSLYGFNFVPISFQPFKPLQTIQTSSNYIIVFANGTASIGHNSPSRYLRYPASAIIAALSVVNANGGIKTSQR